MRAPRRHQRRHGKTMKPLRFVPAILLLVGFGWLFFSSHARATSNYGYKPDEYVVITNGRSPDGKYSIAAHGEGELGYDNFHLFLMDAKAGKKIGALEEIKDSLDTGADAFIAKWAPDSRQVSITYRVDRRESVMVRYRVENGRATRISGPSKVKG
ncbi:hypothetical protein AYO41_00270 [Verrucomicrobia bacterium SCGC AG-212-E04]|nr:hypothetical protein AYO41_00270 [Verrucomicrobia bacterium SCGC AG-212-E04]